VQGLLHLHVVLVLQGVEEMKPLPRLAQGQDVYNGSEDPQISLSFQPQWLGFVACLRPSARLRFESHGDSPENSGNPPI